MGPGERLEKLASPPIVEVICGVFFESLPELDPVVTGTYWQQRRDEFPGHSIRAAAGQAGVVIGDGTPPLRTWLISEDDGPFVIQIQADRFYLNWRRRGEAYPRFSSEEGLRERTLSEFQRFSAFCDEFLSRRPSPAAVELGKIDHLVEGVHWADKNDLAVLVPSLAPILSVAQTGAPEVLQRFREAREDHKLQVTLASARLESANIVRLETTVILPLQGSLGTAFDGANQKANDVFAALIPRDQRQRFQEVD